MGLFKNKQSTPLKSIMQIIFLSSEKKPGWCSGHFSCLCLVHMSDILIERYNGYHQSFRQGAERVSEYGQQ
jgi:hypothetical protein